jgi:glycosyltransferase involved in cell wall biosynthesis
VKICLLTKRFYTGKDLIEDRFGRLYHLPRSWADIGADVDVIALDYRNKWPEAIDEGGLKIRSIPSDGFRLGAAACEVEWENYDLIIASGHLNIARIARSISSKYDVPWVFDVYDFYPAFMGKLSAIAAAYMKRLVRCCYGVMVVSENLERWCSASNQRTCRIPNGVDRACFTSITKEVARAKLLIDIDAPVFGLFGSLSENLGASDVMAAFQKFRLDQTNAKLLVAGSGSSLLSGVGGVRDLGMLDQSELPLHASACDCLLIPYRDTLQVRYSQSARLAEYLSLSRPIVVTRVGDAETWFPVDYPGWCLPSDSGSMCLAMQRQIELKSALPLPDELTWNALGERSYQFLQEVCQSSGR